MKYTVEHSYEGLLYTGPNKTKAIKTFHKWVGITKRQLEGSRYNGEPQIISMLDDNTDFPILETKVEAKSC